jgi:hypothetical protein
LGETGLKTEVGCKIWCCGGDSTGWLRVHGIFVRWHLAAVFFASRQDAGDDAADEVGHVVGDVKGKKARYQSSLKKNRKGTARLLCVQRIEKCAVEKMLQNK